MDIHRYYYPEQIVFITQIVEDRRKMFANPEMVNLLHQILHNVNEYHPFSMLGYAFLPDHFHILIKPTGQSNFSQIMHSIKRIFTKSFKEKNNIKYSLSLWQKRFWDHVIRDEIDLENHLHYIHFNPVKHGYVKDPAEWNDSSFKTWQNRGLYPTTMEWTEPEDSFWGE